MMRLPLFALSIIVGLAPAFQAVAQELPPRPIPAPQPSNAPPAAAGVQPTDHPDQRIRCRVIAATGSLVRRERVCRTVAEWRQISQRGNETARAALETGTGCSGGECRGVEPAGTVVPVPN